MTRQLLRGELFIRPCPKITKPAQVGTFGEKKKNGTRRQPQDKEKKQKEEQRESRESNGQRACKASLQPPFAGRRIRPSPPRSLPSFSSSNSSVFYGRSQRACMKRMIEAHSRSPSSSSPSASPSPPSPSPSSSSMHMADAMSCRRLIGAKHLLSPVQDRPPFPPKHRRRRRPRHHHLDGISKEPQKDGTRFPFLFPSSSFFFFFFLLGGVIYYMASSMKEKQRERERERERREKEEEEEKEKKHNVPVPGRAGCSTGQDKIKASSQESWRACSHRQTGDLRDLIGEAGRSKREISP
ncbi:uncharacterized protein ARB_04465 [Trichophyton benhamiae CBS 112371]|uniref:Uncharacterized protein n=1 Tax=Arthroderma benhamiae (strain ATCC MYA-4681 / CBS 112371) TaxID=663331 RepID=D4AJL5_ARTBC|nr:uncharacterized protein ARB_04465 [Trichophyton benhamiae CBS 112371]EFE36938.1 hypothetical protein ARB_04465 [Trichophyton benhamiae CBS 112371]